MSKDDAQSPAMSKDDAQSSNPGEGEETMLARIIKYELSGLLVLRDKLPQPHGACTICLEGEKGCKISSILDVDHDERFQSFRQCGYLPDALAKPDEFENLLWTCPSCADFFDNPYPTVIILPKNLDFFVLWEHRDYERRTGEANSGGVVSPRTVPEHDDYKGLYKVYVLTNDPTTIPEKLRMRIENDERDLYTEASPTALILHAGRVLGMPMTYPKKYGMSIPVKHKLLELFVLWERQPPRLESPMSTEAAESFLRMARGESSPSPAERKGKGKNKCIVQSKKTGKAKANVKGKEKAKRARSLSSPASSGDTMKSTTKTPKSKRVKMKELTREDDRQRRRAEAQGKEYTSPVSPAKWQYSFSTRSLPKLVLGERKNAARVDRPISAGPSGQKNNEVEENESGDHDEDYEEEEKDGENYKLESCEYSDDDEEGWDYGPQMTSSAIIERASKRSMKR
ncbi:hypothetical protein TWF594_003808 [Orbilia oligospora]|uniref:Uncharacterized protein n=1 Tax=Orbilia oligospora TaxID=2813651 RepID=A0A7C8JRN2_ORBOL|nr:hypothetical protein TWF703_006469 [Orbilia oligospora]KAF3145823.1 hypothetical protein TWF594_003808 [Orbilia oligospora]